jgi:small subunit ribosomal protein S12e
MKTSLFHDGLACGIHEAAKALDKPQAYICVMTSNCDKHVYVKLVGALCAKN